jgi:hypothetical protein
MQVLVFHIQITKPVVRVTVVGIVLAGRRVRGAFSDHPFHVVLVRVVIATTKITIEILPAAHGVITLTRFRGFRGGVALAFVL